MLLPVTTKTTELLKIKRRPNCVTVCLGSRNKSTRVHDSLLKNTSDQKKPTRVMLVELNSLCIDIGKKKELSKFGSQSGSGLKPNAKFSR